MCYVFAIIGIRDLQEKGLLDDVKKDVEAACLVLSNSRKKFEYWKNFTKINT